MKKNAFLLGLLLVALIFAYVFAHLEMPPIKSDDFRPTPSPKPIHRDTIPYVAPKTSVKSENAPEPSPAETEPSTRLNDLDACRAPNAQEVWYRVSANYSPQLSAKNFYFATDGNRTLLIRQERKLDASSKPYVQISASWYDRSNANETMPKEIANEARFLEFQELLDLAGPAWTNGLQPGPLLQEETLTLGKDDENVVLQNKVAVALRARINGKMVVCEKEEDCRCQ